MKLSILMNSCDFSMCSSRLFYNSLISGNLEDDRFVVKVPQRHSSVDMIATESVSILSFYMPLCPCPKLSLHSSHRLMKDHGFSHVLVLFSAHRFFALLFRLFHCAIIVRSLATLPTVVSLSQLSFYLYNVQTTLKTEKRDFYFLFVQPPLIDFNF